MDDLADTHHLKHSKKIKKIDNIIYTTITLRAILVGVILQLFCKNPYPAVAAWLINMGMLSLAK